MHEILILYILTSGQNTLYGISKSVLSTFGYITAPSYGTIQPALKRLEKNNFIKSDKFFTDGGKPYVYYSLTQAGKESLIKKIKSQLPLNPIQLIPELKIKLICSSILEKQEKSELYKLLKSQLVKLKKKAEDMQTSDIYSNNYEGRMVLNTSVCEFQNLYNLIEGLEKCLQ